MSPFIGLLHTLHTVVRTKFFDLNLCPPARDCVGLPGGEGVGETEGRGGAVVLVGVVGTEDDEVAELFFSRAETCAVLIDRSGAVVKLRSSVELRLCVFVHCEDEQDQKTKT